MSQTWVPPRTELEDKGSGVNFKKLGMDTKATSSTYKQKGVISRPLTVPIVHSATFIMNTVQDFLDISTQSEGGGIYSRLSNYTCDSLEASLLALEGGAGSIAFASGMAAFTAVWSTFLKQGDHIIINNPSYSGVYAQVKHLLPKFGIQISFVPSGCPVSEYKRAVKPNTRLLFGETPSNPDMCLLDLEEFGKLGQSLKNVLTVVDSTFCSPCIQQPMNYGIDICLQSCTKYIGGHSDLIAGSLTTRTVEQWKQLKVHQVIMGTMLSPHDASLVIRGIKTLPIRMQKHSSNALKIAEYLEKHPKILTVMYPGLKSHPQHSIAKKQMKNGFSGVMSIEVKGGLRGGKALVENVKLIQLGVSLGGVQSLIEHPATMTHGPIIMTDEDRKLGRITDGMVRLSVGIEDPNDLIEDIKQALDKLKI